MAIRIVTSVLTLISGTGIFLVACGMLRDGVVSLSGRRFVAMLDRAGKSKLAGVGIGAGMTAAVQSSSAVTVMIIGLADSGAMTLLSAAPVIFGANIGTCITAFFAALGGTGGGISVSIVMSALAGVGAFVMTFTERERFKRIGGALAGLGMLFASLEIMGGAMSVFGESEGVRNFIAAFESPVLLIIVGTVMTAVVQSSSVMTSITVAMTVSGLITLEQGVYLTMGSNVGTCITALLASAAGGGNAKRVALIHIIFNCVGVLIFSCAGAALALFGTNYGRVLDGMFVGAPQLKLAVFHLIFNLTTACIMLPFTRRLVRAVSLVPDRSKRKRRRRITAK